jgi:hypothetical protein
MRAASKLQPSDEQHVIVSAVIDGKNVCVDAVAGSGKTTTILFIAEAFQRPILVLTYNARLKEETRERIRHASHVEVHSYHSLAKTYYGMPGYTDLDMLHLLERPEQLMLLRKIDKALIILDEQQDMTPLYWKLVKYVMAHNICTNAQLVILGDRNQSIFTFNGANKEYLTNIGNLIHNEREWIYCTLRISYRLTATMAEFINKIVLQENRITAPKTHIILPNGQKRPILPVHYYVDSKSFSYGGNDIGTYEKYRLIKQFLNIGYKPDDIFIIAAKIRANTNKSLRQQMPIVRLENELVHKGQIPIFVPNSDEDAIDDSIIKGKLVISTFNQVKGLERKIVIIFGFDMSYYYYFCKAPPSIRCPDIFYVALTRAKEHLIIFHDVNFQPLPFLDLSLLDLPPLCNKGKTSDRKSFSVIELLRHLSVDRLQKALTYLAYNTIQSANTSFETQSTIKLPKKVRTNKQLYEAVADINGTTLPALHEYTRLGTSAIINSIITDKDTWKRVLPRSSTRIDLEELLNELFPPQKIDIELIRKFLYLTNVYNALTGGYCFKLYQIKKYNWLDKCNVDRYLQKYDKYLTLKSRYEEKLKRQLIDPDLRTFDIIGYADNIDDTTLWELKCVDGPLRGEHVLQLACYIWLTGDTCPQFAKLYNVLTDEIIELDIQKCQLNELMQFLVKCKTELDPISTPEAYDINAIRQSTPAPNFAQRFIPRAEDWTDIDDT